MEILTLFMRLSQTIRMCMLFGKIFHTSIEKALFLIPLDGSLFEDGEFFTAFF